jgi:hypothetical protein
MPDRPPYLSRLALPVAWEPLDCAPSPEEFGKAAWSNAGVLGFLLHGVEIEAAQALNQTLATINQQTAFSPASGAAALLGNVSVEQLRQTLLNALTAQLGVGNTSAGTSFNSLSSVGFQITSGGTVKLDTQKFQSAAQSDYTAVASLLGAIGVASNANVGVTSVGAASPGSYAVMRW